MKRIASIAAAAVLLAASAQPCLAAEDLRELSAPHHRTGTFVGATVRLAAGADSAPKPQARLQMGFSRHHSDARSAAPGTSARVATFELGASAKGKPALFMGGRDVRGLKDRLGMSTGGAIAIGAGVVVGLLALAMASASAVDGDSLCWDGEDCD
jgi:hypothetical protein